MSKSVGQSVVVERTLTQRDFDVFAELSGDNNPIHVDPAFSARTGFKRTVAHGMLLYTVLRGLVDRIAPGARQASQSLMFPAPAFADEPIRFEVWLDDVDPSRRSVLMRATRIRDDICVCDASCRLEIERGER